MVAPHLLRVAHTIQEVLAQQRAQVRRLLASREDVFPGYTLEAFETAFSQLFEVTRREAVPGTARTLFSMRRRQPIP